MDVVEIAAHDANTRGRRSHKARRDEAIQRIMDSAISLLCEKGFAGLTLLEAGERAGYSRGLAGHYFGDKPGLLAAMVERIGSDVRNTRKSIANWSPGLETVIGMVASYLGRNPIDDITMRALHLLLSERLVSPGPLAHALERLNAESIEIIEEQLRVGIRDGNIRPDLHPNTVAISIIGSMRGVSAQFLFLTDPAAAAPIRQSFIDMVRQTLTR